jgi:citrate lyase alpha subunit
MGKSSKTTDITTNGVFTSIDGRGVRQLVTDEVSCGLLSGQPFNDVDVRQRGEIVLQSRKSISVGWEQGQTG